MSLCPFPGSGGGEVKFAFWLSRTLILYWFLDFELDLERSRFAFVFFADGERAGEWALSLFFLYSLSISILSSSPSASGSLEIRGMEEVLFVLTGFGLGSV